MSKPNEPSWLAAKKRGQFIIEGAPDRVLCDLDDERAAEVFRQQIQQMLVIRSTTFASTTAGHRHGYVVLAAPMSAARRVDLSAQLGSDPEYVAHCRARVEAGDVVPIVLFETREAFYDVHQWLAEGKDQL